MAKHRTRDSVWITALNLARAGNAVTPKIVVENSGAGERTVRETLNVMSDTPFLDREMKDGKVRYVAGDGITTFEPTPSDRNQGETA
jgi:hypothetical protein